MSPILVRPVREQLEHDRLIRFLVSKYQGKYEVMANVGDTQPAPVKLGGPAALYPDLVLLTKSKIAGLVEVETAESTNNLEAMAQWQHFSRARVPFHLYVPTLMLDAALRFCETYDIGVTEIWTYRSLLDGFDLVRAFHNPTAVAKTPKGVSVVAKLLPPVTPQVVEPEKDTRLAELTSLVELANRTFRVAAGKTAAANAAAKAASASARAAARAAKAAAAAEKAAAKQAAATSDGPATGAVKPAAQPAGQASAAQASKGAAPKSAPKGAGKPSKAVKAAAKPQAAKAVKNGGASGARARPVKKAAAKPGKPSAKAPRKPVARKKPASKAVRKATSKPKSRPVKKVKAAASRPKKGAGKR